MTSNMPYAMLIFFMAFVIGTLIVFFVHKIMVNRTKVNLLCSSRKKAEECIDKNIAELNPLLNLFYGDQSESYLKEIKKQHQQVSNQFLVTLIEDDSNIVNTLTNALEIMHQNYMKVFSELSEFYQELCKEGTLSKSAIDEELKEIILMMAQICKQEINEKLFDEVSLITNLKEKIKSSFIENKSLAEEASQYMDLIEQLRIEKKDMRQTITQSLEILQQIYQKYQNELKLPENKTFKQFNYDDLLSAFNLNEPSQQ